jgi:hypothetical protein
MKEKIILDEGDTALLEMLDDVVIFGEFIRSTDESIDEGSGWGFDNYQKLMILDESPYISVCTGRTTGKTISLETKIIYNVVSNKYKNASANEVVLVVQNKAQLEPVFLRLTQFFRRHPFLKNFVDRTSVNFSEHLIKLLNGATIRCRIVGSSADSNIIGLHAPCIFVDEAQVFNYVAWNSLGQCFLVGTKISTPTGVTNIEDIREGDIVLSSRETGHRKIVEQRVSKIIKRELLESMVLVKTDDSSVVCTSSHEFLTCDRKGGNSKVYHCASDLEDKHVTTMIDLSLIGSENHNVNMEDLIFGSLLGDMCAQKRGHLSVSHVDFDYSRWKCDILRDLAYEPMVLTYTTKVNKLVRKYLRIDTKAVFHDIRYLCYPNGKKTITIEWLNKLTLPAVAVWYMDDGSINGGDFVSIGTFGFEYDEQKLLVNYLKNVFGFDFDIRTDGKRPIGKQHYLVCRNPEKFITDTLPYAIPSMYYKFRLPISKSIRSVSSVDVNDKYVYDLEVEGIHNYIANGFVVHNCITMWDANYQMWLSGVPNGMREKNILHEADQLDNKWSRHNVSRLQSPRYTKEQHTSDLKQYGGAEGDDYVHLVLGEHGVPAFSVFDRKLMKIESYDVTLGMINNLTLEQAGGKFNEVLNTPDFPISIQPDLVACGIDAGFSSDPTIITILYRQHNLWREFLRYELRRIKYPTQAKIIDWLDNIYHFNMITLDAGSSGLALGQMLQELEEFKHKNYQKRLTLVDFQGGVIVGYDDEGKEQKDRIRKFTIKTLQKWSQSDQIIVFSDRDDDMISELERVGFTRDMLGEPKYFVYSPTGGQRGDDHILASLLTWVYGYYYEYYSPEKPSGKGKYSDLAHGGWNIRD